MDGTRRTTRVTWLGVHLAAIMVGGCASARSGAWAEVSQTRYADPNGYGVAAQQGVDAFAAGESVEEQYGVQFDYEVRTYPETEDGEGTGGSLADWGAPAPQPQPEPRYAQADPPEPRGAGGTSGTTPTSPAATATDALPADTALLIYTATLTVAVLHVEEQQNAVQQLAESVGGYLAQRDARTIVVRIPVQRFQEVLQATESFGDVLDRNVRTEDVTEEFRDTTIRLRNLEVMRTRLEALLTQAENVNDALAVEREMQRVTEELERLRGRIRYLQDQIAYSTITVNFRPSATEVQRINEFRLPFQWLDRLGLPRLLEVR